MTALAPLIGTTMSSVMKRAEKETYKIAGRCSSAVLQEEKVMDRYNFLASGNAVIVNDKVHNGKYVRYEDAAARIAELEAQLAAAQERERWIPAKERLPDSIRPVLIDTDEYEDTSESNNLYIAVLHGKYWLLRSASGNYSIEINGTYWRELPLPKREVTNDQA